MLNQRLKEIRKALNLTQKDIAKAIGLEQGSYSDLERGRVQTLSNSVQILLQEKFNVNIDYLLKGDVEMFLDTTQFSIVEKSKPNYHATQQKQLPKSHSMETQDYDELRNKIRELEKQIELYLSLLKSKDNEIRSKENELKSKDDNIALMRELIEQLKEQKEILKQRNECYSIVEKKGASQR